ncbi:hypothetical protein HSRCO_0680 [Halanaeroarchaeum sp. HSR-CO]|nr:hypothetical protein HSRCO_0680 [Halanaeroarchaeum sp. HSR-CO]
MRPPTRPVRPWTRRPPCRVGRSGRVNPPSVCVVACVSPRYTPRRRLPSSRTNRRSLRRVYRSYGDCRLCYGQYSVRSWQVAGS